jgi:hypothetical protein
MKQIQASLLGAQECLHEKEASIFVRKECFLAIKESFPSK